LVSGASAVPDEALWRTLGFIRDSGLSPETAGVAALCEAFERDGVLPAGPELTRWKGLVRRMESAGAARVCGIALDHLHFLDLPFYSSAEPRRRRLSAADTELMAGLLAKVKPHLIYTAGDLDDPHGTHRLCLHALRDALAGLTEEAWAKGAELWLYRGAWAEWPIDEIDLAVPLSPDEVLRRRRAIFRHETQKDQALFLGNDRREFWQRTEDRSRRIAQAYDALGLAEYEAIEAFKRFELSAFVNDTRL
jgi:glucosamine-6-phosphate deaminase